jgi:hypothetical protein
LIGVGDARLAVYEKICGLFVSTADGGLLTAPAKGRPGLRAPIAAVRCGVIR